MMQSHLYSVLAKAHRYEAEPERFELLVAEPLAVAVHGLNAEHTVALRNGHLECNCEGFAARGEHICAHVLGVEHHFRGLTPPDAVVWPVAP